jgi:hypothetical protein
MFREESANGKATVEMNHYIVEIALSNAIISACHV